MAFKLSSRILAGLPAASRRNFATSYMFMAKVNDPIQQLFLDKIHEFGSKLNDKNFVKQNPDLQKQLDDELNRVTTQFGGTKPEDLLDFPKPKIQEPELDPHPGF